MSTLRCPRCDLVISAKDEDDLVAKVRSHVREDHGLEHELPRRHILARARDQDARTDGARADS